MGFQKARQDFAPVKTSIIGSIPLKAREGRQRGLALIFCNTFLLHSDSFCQEKKKEEILEDKPAREESNGKKSYECKHKESNVLKGTQKI